MEAVKEWEQEAEEERGEEEKVVDECGMTGMTGAPIYTENWGWRYACKHRKAGLDSDWGMLGHGK